MQFHFGDEITVAHGFFKGVKGKAINAKTSTNYGTTSVQEVQLDTLPMGVWVPAFECEKRNEAP